MKALSLVLHFVLLATFLVPSVTARRRRRARATPVRALEGIRRIVALSDVHGALPQLIATLADVGVARPGGPRCSVEWTGGETALVLIGDFGDRGDHTRGVYQLLDCLGPQARRAGGWVVPLLGNHETMLLSGEVAKRAVAGSAKSPEYQRTVDSLTWGGKSMEYRVGPRGHVGRQLRQMPVYLSINGRYGFMHGGLGVPLDTATLARRFRACAKSEAWDSAFLSPTTTAEAAASPVWARDWWEDPRGVQRLLSALQVEYLIFGHTPGAFVRAPGEEGKVLRRGPLFKVDVGMSPAYGYSNGGCLEIIEEGGVATFTAHAPGQPPRSLDRALPATGITLPGPTAR